MDPKSCRQTSHWINVMICSLPLDFSTPPQFCLIEVCFSTECFMILLMTLSTTGEVRSRSTRGVFSRPFFWHHSAEKCNMKSAKLNSHTRFNVVPSFHFHVQVLRRLLELNTASGAPFKELLCLWWWRWWCWGGAALVSEGYDREEGGYLNFQKGQSCPLLQSHTWLSSLQVCSTFFL